MAVNEIHKLDIGTIFEITLYDGDVIVNISGATAKTILFTKSDKVTVVEQAAAFKTDGTDGIIQYTTIADDLDQTGSWKIQARVALSSGWTGSSDIGSFRVYANLD